MLESINVVFVPSFTLFALKLAIGALFGTTGGVFVGIVTVASPRYCAGTVAYFVLIAGVNILHFHASPGDVIEAEIIFDASVCKTVFLNH